MAQIQFIGTTPQELQNQISGEIKTQLEDFLKNFAPKQPNDYLTRKQVSEMFDVDISTIHNWCKSGKLKPLQIGSRVYFLRSDIDECLIPLNQ